MPYTLHLNVDYSDNHTDWFHLQNEVGDTIRCHENWRQFGPFEDIAERVVKLDAMAQMALDEAYYQLSLFD